MHILLLHKGAKRSNKRERVYHKRRGKREETRRERKNKNHELE